MSREQYQRAFVLQFSPSSEQHDAMLEGRVEHVASGQASQFRSLQELEQFVRQMLADSPMPGNASASEPTAGSDT